MPTITVYDPPMSCAAGVCGPEGDDTEAQFIAALERARAAGASVERYDLGNHPGAFATNALVRSALQRDGMACLPLVLVDGEILAKGAYPTCAVMAKRFGFEPGLDGDPAPPTSHPADGNPGVRPPGGKLDAQQG